MSVQVVILAAGQGKRMHSKLPKVLHTLAGKSLLERVIDTAEKISTLQPIVIYGHQGSVLQQALSHRAVKWAHQSEQLGTGHAVLQAMPAINQEDHVLILCGDVPLIGVDTLQRFMQSMPANAIGMMTATLDNPFGYGRVKRDTANRVMGVIEEKDATVDEKRIREINTGIYFVPSALLQQWLPTLNNQNAQQEYYLTEILLRALESNIMIHTSQPTDNNEVMGVNDRMQLAHLERAYQLKTAEQFMQNGVTLRDPARFDVRGDVTIGKDVIIDVNVILEGKVVIEDDCVIGPNTTIRDATIGQGVKVYANSVIEGAVIGKQCVIGPFARIRPDTVLADKVHIGNFVEIKKSSLGVGSKANHLTYLGDSEIGSGVNVGAGTITCNYDGVNKHKTIIENDAFIGSCTQLVAPVTVGEGATIGAGSTITHDAPAHKLTLSRVPQQTISEWKRPKKKEA